MHTCPPICKPGCNFPGPNCHISKHLHTQNMPTRSQKQTTYNYTYPNSNSIHHTRAHTGQGTSTDISSPGANNVSHVCIHVPTSQRARTPRWLPIPITHHPHKYEQHRCQHRSLKSAATRHTALTPRDHPPPMNYASPTPRHVQNPAFPTQRESFSGPAGRQRPAHGVPGRVPPLSLSPLPSQTPGGPWHLSGQCQGPVGSLPSRSLLPPRRAPTPAARGKRSEPGEREKVCVGSELGEREREKACSARVQNSQSPQQSWISPSHGENPACPPPHHRRNPARTPEVTAVPS